MGFIGAVLVGVGLLGRGIVIFRREKVASDVEKDARFLEMKEDRDSWRAAAERTIGVQEKQADVAEGQARDIHRLADSSERTATILGIERKPEQS